MGRKGEIATVIIATLPPGLKIKQCAYGHGIFSHRNFMKGKLIAKIKDGRVVSKRESKMRLFALRVPGTDLYWEDEDITKMEWHALLNHSENANSFIDFSGFNVKSPKARLVATRDISKGEEITINYHHYNDRLYKSKRYKGNTVQRLT